MAISKFVPRTDGTGSIGTSNLAWNEGHFNNATFKQDITVTGNADIGGTATISNINSTNVTVTGGIEYAAGTTSLQGESSPTGAAPSSTTPGGVNSLHLYGLPENKFFAFSLFGDLTIKEGKAPWRKCGAVGAYDSSYFSGSGMWHCKLADGTTRLALQVMSNGDSGSRLRLSDDYGETWFAGGGMLASYYHGGRSKTNNDCFSYDGRTQRDFVHLTAVNSFNNNAAVEINPTTGKPWTVAELTADYLGANTQAHRVSHEFLTFFAGYYQTYMESIGQNVWTSSTNPASIITVDMMKNFGWCTGGDFDTFNRAYGALVGDTAARARRLYSRNGFDSRADFGCCWGYTYPGTDTVYTWASGIKTLMTAIGNGETIDSAWFAANGGTSRFWMGTFSSRMARKYALYEVESLPSVSNAFMMYVGGFWIPVSASRAPNDLHKIGDFGSSGVKRWGSPKDSDGESLPHLRVEYIDEETLLACGYNTGKLYEIDCASLSNALTLANSDGSDWDEEAAQNSVTKFKTNVFVDGVDVPLNGGGGESSNSDSVAVGNINQYVVSGPNGYVAGLGDNGYATLRDLQLDSYDSLSGVWQNTTANGFSVPAFAGGGVYHGGLKKLHFNFAASFGYSVPSLAVDASNNWSSGFIGNMPGRWVINPKFDDNATHFQGGRSGDAQYVSKYTSSGISWFNHSSFQTSSSVQNALAYMGYARDFPGQQVNYVPPGYMANNKATMIRLSNGDILVNSYDRMNSGTWTQNRWIAWYGFHLVQYSDETFGTKVADRAWSASHYSNGNDNSYYQTCLNLLNQGTRNENRDVANYPHVIDAIAISGSSTGQTLDGNSTGLTWLRNTDASGRFRKVGTYFGGQTGAVAFSRHSDPYNFENTSSWSTRLVAYRDNSFTMPITTSITNRDGWVAFDFVTPSGSISSILSAAGESNPSRLCYTNPADSNQVRLPLYFEVIKSDNSIGFRKLIEFRDGSNTDWSDNPFLWQNVELLNSTSLGWIFSGGGYNTKHIYQMPNGDLIPCAGSEFKIVALEALDGDSGLYIDDPTFRDRAIRAQYFGKAWQSQSSIFDGSTQSIAGTATALSPNHLVVWRGNSTMAWIESDGNGNFVNGVRFDPPSGQNPRSDTKAVAANNTLYYVNPSEGRCWHTSIANMFSLASSSTHITPNWTEINPADTGLSKIFGVSYHPGSETYYLSGNSGLYSKSTNGTTNWSIDINPQYAFASQPTTGLYKDLEHSLHLVHKGDLSFTVSDTSVGSLKPLGLGTKDPDLASNLTIQAFQDTSGDQTVVQFRDLAGDDIGKIQVDTSTNTTKYTTSSDYRLKLNIDSFNDPVNRLMSLKPCSWTWKNSGLKGEGFIAHEVSDIVPEAISGEKDATKISEYTIPDQYSNEDEFETVINEEGEEVEIAKEPTLSISGRTITTETPVYQSIDQSKLVPLLTASLQETIKELNSLKDRVNKLENN